MALRLGTDYPATFVEGEMFKPTIDIAREKLPTAIRHGCELWWDGSTPTHRLDTRGGDDGFTRFVNARIEGKLAEVAFSKFLEEYYGVESQVDWRIYGDYQTTDDGDLQYVVGDNGEEYTPSAHFDVKKTKPWNQWLAVRSNIYRTFDNDAPIILTKLSLQDDIDLSPWESTGEWDAVDQDDQFRDRLLEYADDNFPLQVDLVGTAYPDEFTDRFEKGDHLYDPSSGGKLGAPLKRDNVGIHVSDLKNSASRWNRVALDILGGNPVSFNPIPILDRKQP